MGKSIDRNLLFGMMAVELQVIERQQLLEHLAEAETEDIANYLQRKDLLPPETKAKIEAMVDAWVSASTAMAADSTKRTNLDHRNPHTQGSLFSVTGHADQSLFSTDEPERLTTRIPASPNHHPLHSLEIQRLLARGGLGKVSVAHDPNLERDVAVKEILPRLRHSPRAVRRFLNEARIAGRLQHPNIVPIYAMGEKDGDPFYVMQLIDGDSLQDGIRQLHLGKKRKPFEQLEPGKVRRLIRALIDTCNAMAYCHSNDIVHRDLKPANIMLGSYGETLVVDWGLAKHRDDPDPDSLDEWESDSNDSPAAKDAQAYMQTLEGDVVGTPAFMSPEQAAGLQNLITARSDVYSLGACLYSLLANAPPYEGTREEIIARVQVDSAPDLRQKDPSVPAQLQAIYRKAMRTEPDKRYASAADMAKDLEHWLEGEAVSAHPDSIVTKANRWARKHQAVVWVSFAAMVLGMGGLLIANQLISHQASKNYALWKDSQGRVDRALDSKEKADEALLAAESKTLKLQKQLNGLAKVIDSIFTDSASFRLARFPNSLQIRLELAEYGLSQMQELDKNYVNETNTPEFRAVVLRATKNAAFLNLANGQLNRADELTADLQREITNLERACVTEPLIEQYIGKTADAYKDLALLLHKLVNPDESDDKRGSAERAIEKSLAKYEVALGVSGTSNTPMAYADGLIKAIDIYLANKKPEKAEKAVEILERLIPTLNSSEPAYLAGLFRSLTLHRRVSIILEHAKATAPESTGNTLSDAMKRLNESEAIVKQLRKDKPGNIDVLLVEGELAMMRFEVQRKLESVAAAADQMVRHIQQMRSAVRPDEPLSMLRQRIISLEVFLAERYKADGQWQPAVNWAEQALQDMEEALDGSETISIRQTLEDQKTALEILEAAADTRQVFPQGQTEFQRRNQLEQLRLPHDTTL